MQNIKEKLKQTLSQRQVQQVLKPGLLKSAVLVPISYKEGEHYIIFTKRTQIVKHHKGEMSFPGGIYEETDGTLVNTALRESFEEIGLSPADVEILGKLDDTVTRTTNFVVSPFVALIPATYNFRLNAKEAEQLVTVPIMALLDESCLHESPSGSKYFGYDYHYRGTVITGATARILRQFLEIFTEVLNKKQTKPEK